MEDAEKMVDMHYQNIKGKIYNAEFNTLNTMYVEIYGSTEEGMSPGH